MKKKKKTSASKYNRKKELSNTTSVKNTSTSSNAPVKSNKKRNVIIGICAALAVVLIATAVIIIVSANSTDSDKTHRDAVLGTWELRSDFTSEVITIEFKSNNKYIYTRSFSSSSRADISEEGTYTIADGNVTLISENDTKSVLTYEYDSATGTITYLSDFVKKN